MAGTVPRGLGRCGCLRQATGFPRPRRYPRRKGFPQCKIIFYRFYRKLRYDLVPAPLRPRPECRAGRFRPTPEGCANKGENATCLLATLSG